MSEQFYIFMQLSAHEYFTAFCPSEQFKTPAKLHYQALLCVCG